MLNFPSQHSSHQVGFSGRLPLLHGMAISTIQRRIYVTQSNGRQVDISHLCERLGISSGIGDQQKPSLQEVLLDLSNESPLSPEAAANVSTANRPGEVLEETRLTSAVFSIPLLTFFM